MADDHDAKPPPTKPTAIAKGVRRLGDGCNQVPFSPQSARCSFCGKSEREVDALFAGAAAYICNQCLAQANAILAGGQDQDNEED